MATTSPNSIYYHTKADAPVTEESRSLAAATSIQTALNTKAESSHTHAGSAITSGTLDMARLPSGTVIQQTHFTYNTYTNGTGTTYVDIHSGTRPSIVAKRSDSHFIILASMNWLQEGSRRQVIRCLRDGNPLSPSDIMIANNVSWTSGNLFYQWKDTSARSAGTTYTFSFQTAVTAGTWYYNYNFGGITGTSMYSIWEIVA